MAFVDAAMQYSYQQALSGAGSVASTNVLDHSSDRDIGIGEPLCVVISVDTALAGTSPTLSVALQVASSPAFGSPVSIATSQTFTALAAGARFVVPVPADYSFDRASRLNYTLGGTTPSVTLTANLVPRRFVQSEQMMPGTWAVL